MAKEKIGVFSEADAKKIARAVQKFLKQPSGNRGRQRKRVVSGGALNECDPLFSTLDTVEIETGDAVLMVRDGCLVLAEIRECDTANAAREAAFEDF